MQRALKGDVNPTKRMLLATTIAGSMIFLAAPLHPQTAAAPAPVAKTAVKAPRKPAAAPVTYHLDTLPKRGREYYNVVWGIDSLSVRQAESGELIRFSWRVIDPERAKLLNDKKIEPELFDLQAGVKLVVPQVEFAGPLRVVTTPQTGKVSWIAFSNLGRRVKAGDRVNIVVGQFHVNGLLVE